MKVAIALAGLAGCAWGAGEPFGELSATLDVRWEAAADRDAGGGWQRLASDYQVQIETASWTTTKLVFTASAGEALAFDPASPPPGYTLCHGGHCHATDGRLVSYEEISAELTGGAALPPVLELPTGAIDLVAGGGGELACDGAPCAIGLSTIGRVELEVTAYAITGRVRDGRVPARRSEGTFSASAALEAPVRATGELGLEVDRGHAPKIHVSIGAFPGAALFDGVDWATDLDSNQLDLITTATAEVELTLDADRE